jgi:hypothetical protein
LQALAIGFDALLLTLTPMTQFSDTITDLQLVEQLSEYYRLHTQAIRFLSFFRRFHSIQHLPEFGGRKLNGAKPERDKEFGFI